MLAKDVFLSHAYEDKDRYAIPLVRNLDNYSISYWLDKIEIGWGNSIVGRINEGLANSKFVLVLLTESFLKKRWTIAELEAALSSEISNGEISVLPVMIAEPEKIFNSFPLIRRKLYLAWDEGTDYIASQLSMLLKREFKPEWIGSHPVEYYGKVWIQILKQEKNINKAHNISVNWGPWQYNGVLPPDFNISVTLTHAKGNDMLSIPIFFKIDPPCFVKFGQDEPVGDNIVDINYGWKRVRGR